MKKAPYKSWRRYQEPTLWDICDGLANALMWLVVWLLCMMILAQGWRYL